MLARTALKSLLPALLGTTLVAQVDLELAAKIKHEGIENSQVMVFQNYLCNYIGGRLTSSDNFARACEWGREQFEKMGLDAKLEKWDTWNTGWNRGQWMGRIVSPEPMELMVATAAWTAPTKGAQKGRLVRVPKDETELDAIENLAEVWLWGRKPRGGAVADALAQTPPLGFVSAGSGDRRYPTQIRVFGSRTAGRAPYASRPTTPAIVVRADQAKKIEMMLQDGKEIVAQFDVRNRFVEGPIDLHNVVAELKGSEKPDEYVYVCGHLDSWHQATGATDNGTGSCSTLEVARILTAVGAKPKRTIRFCLWGGEEQGLLGSNKHVTMRRTEMANVSAVFNHDSGTNWAQRLTVTEQMFPMMEKVAAPIMSMKPPQEDWDKGVFNLGKGAVRGGGGSDHASFLRAGVPAWSIGLQSQGNRPYGYGWHSQWDTYDIVVPEYQAHTSTVLALLALGTANLPEKLSREGINAGGGGRRGGRRGDATQFVKTLLGVELDAKLAVKEVVADGYGTKLGLKKGDVVQKILDRECESTSDVFRAFFGVRDLGKDEKFTMVVKRGGKAVTLKAAPPEVQFGRRGGRRGGGGGDAQGGTGRRGGGGGN